MTAVAHGAKAMEKEEIELLRQDRDAARRERDEMAVALEEQRRSNEQADDECMGLKVRIKKYEMNLMNSEAALYYKTRQRVEELEKEVADFRRYVARLKDTPR